MKALILNSGMGSRMGAAASGYPKCMTDIPGGGVYRSEPAVKNAGRGGSLRDYYNDRLV